MVKKASSYPPYYLQRARRKWRGYALTVALAGTATAFFAYRAIFGSGVMEFALGSSAGFLFLLWVGYTMGVSRVRLALYLEDQVPGAPIWSEVLARHCVALDKIALGAGLTPLSDFGFGDDLNNEMIVWHAPEHGLQAISGLVQELESRCFSADSLPAEEAMVIAEADAIIADLESVRDRLLDACKSQTRFCFIFHEDAINGIEIEMRKGHF